MAATHVTEEGLCWACGAKFNRFSSLETEEPPVAGDASVCIRCGCISILDEEGRLRGPTKEELREVVRSSDVRELQQAVRNLGKLRAGKSAP